ncbi:hypothetical protein AGOR_G00154250 [Albula goreensis]|uniref:Uncharacterized protein n=1 Tax=Albula goreensis TaxID=1534307 RepID=A0A8T3D1V3_9TELE|nr:hypothetical protein AGOR_G00154250 [Albula goreensis]
MSSFDRLDVLRDQNKSLLTQLNDLRGRRPNLNVGPSGPRIACLSETSLQTAQQAGPHTGVSKTASLIPSSSQEGTALHVSGDQAESPASVESVSVVTLPGGQLGQARAALSRPRAPLTTELLASRTDRDQEEALASETDLFRRTTPLLHFGSQDMQSRGSPGYSERLQDEGNRRLVQAWQAGPKRPKSTPSFQERDQREMMQMTSEELDQDQDEERHACAPCWDMTG